MFQKTSIMSYTRKIAHNTVIQIAGKAVSTLIGIVVIGMLTRYLGQAGFGQYTTVMAFLQFFGVLVDLGLYVILVKRIAEPGADREQLASNIFTLRLVSAIVFLGIAPLVAMLFPYPGLVKVGIAITTLSYLGITLNQALSGVFQWAMRMDRVVTAEVVGRIVLVGSTYFAIRTDAGLLWVLAAVVAGSLVNFALTFLFSRPLVRIRLAFDAAVWRSIIREAWPIALSIAFNLVYFKADTIILSLYKSEAVVGVYGASYKVLEVLTTLPAMFAGLVLPLLASTWAAGDRERFRRVLGKAFDAMAMVALPLAVGTMFLATPVMNLIAPSFTDAAVVLRILIVATAIIFIGNLFGNTVVAINRQKTMMWLYLAVAVVSLAGYLFFIPRYSYYGAAGMTVASELLVTVSAALIVLRTARVRLPLTTFGKSLLSCAAMAAVLYLLRSTNIAILLAAGTMTYGLVMVATGGLSREVLREVFSRQQPQ
ncbi:MAG: flippase [Patescibacteria group bacterium]